MGFLPPSLSGNSPYCHQPEDIEFEFYNSYALEKLAAMSEPVVVQEPAVQQHVAEHQLDVAHEHAFKSE